jgi:hypothetical protein
MVRESFNQPWIALVDAILFEDEREYWSTRSLNTTPETVQCITGFAGKG